MRNIPHIEIVCLEAANMDRFEGPRWGRWRSWVLGVLLLMGLWSCVCRFADHLAARDIPNVMGLYYEDADALLRERGFQVTSVPADPDSILACSPWNRSVKAGCVFSVNGERDPNCSSLRARGGSVLLYYAAADYFYEPGTEQPEPPLLVTNLFPVETKAPPGGRRFFV